MTSEAREPVPPPRSVYECRTLEEYDTAMPPGWSVPKVSAHMLDYVKDKYTGELRRSYSANEVGKYRPFPPAVAPRPPRESFWATYKKLGGTHFVGSVTTGMK